MAVGGISGSISQITIRLIAEYGTKLPAVTPAPKPTISTDFGSLMEQRRQVSEHALQPHVVGLGGGLHLAADVELDGAVVPLA